MSKAKIDELSVFLPTYNEEGNIEKVTKDTKKVLQKIAKKWEIIIVNDGSTDNTGKVAQQISKADDRIRVVSHKKNKGYGGALKTGYKNSKYEWVAFMDSDGQFNFSEIKKLISKQKKTGADLILGYRLKRADSFTRKLFAFTWDLIAKILLGLDAKDYSTGFWMIRKGVYDSILPLEAEEKVTKIEMLVKAKRMNFKFAEVGVHHYPRGSGEQTGANPRIVIKSVVDLFKLWWAVVDKKELAIVLLILSVGAFLRLFKIGGYMTFLGDEGRDAIIVRRLLVDFDPILIGPGTSIGNMFLGPFYYYMMAPALLLAGFSPIGPAIQVAVLGVITIWLVWYITKQWFGSLAAHIAAGLYAIAPTVIIFSRSSWNPNIMPFFALLTIFAIWKYWTQHKYKWIVICGASFAAAMQSHYLGLLLLPVIGLFWLLTLISAVRRKDNFKKFIVSSLLGLLVFAFMMSPLVIFDARHGWQNFGSMKIFFTQRQTTVNAKPWKAIPNLWPIAVETLSRLLGGRSEIAGKWTAIGLVIGTFWLFGMIKNRAKELFLLLVWLGVALVGMGLYKQQIYDHYYGFFFAGPFILLGVITQKLIKNTQSIRYLVILAVIALFLVNLKNSPIQFPPNRQLTRTEQIARKIQREADGDRFNLAVIAERNYEDAYQYFLEQWNTRVVDIDAQRVDETVTEQLFVVCELPEEKCDPTHSPKAEVAGFGWTVIDQQWEVSGVTLYRLVASQ